MRSDFHNQLENVNRMLLDMAAKVELNIARALEGCRTNDLRSLEEVVEMDCEIDRAEKEIDEKCVSLLALYQPVARDLRFLTTALKIVKDIERIGDLARNLARQGLGKRYDKMVPFPAALNEMANDARELLRKALDSFVRLDPVRARQVIDDDWKIDRYHSDNLQEFIAEIQADPEAAGSFTQYISVNKFIERIADHSTNIAAMVVYMVEGLDVRHQQAADSTPPRR